MTNTIPITVILALSPANSPPLDVADIEVTTRDGVVTVTAYDADGEASAEVIAWNEGNTRILNATFPDGLYLFAVVDGEQVTVESDDAPEVAARVAAIDSFLEETPPQESWGGCALGVIGAVGFCTTPNVVGCMIGVGMVGCHCVPLALGTEECI